MILFFIAWLCTHSINRQSLQGVNKMKQTFQNIPSLEQSSTAIHALEFAVEFKKTATATATTTATATSLNKIEEEDHFKV